MSDQATPEPRPLQDDVGGRFVDTPCPDCRHLWWPEDVNRCSAFPQGIPNEIARGDDWHEDPYPGDHGIQREEIPNQRLPVTEVAAVAVSQDGRIIGYLWWSADGEGFHPVTDDPDTLHLWQTRLRSLWRGGASVQAYVERMQDTLTLPFGLGEERTTLLR